MSGQELLAIFLGLFFGYLLISKFFDKGAGKQESDPGPKYEEPPPWNAPLPKNEPPSPAPWYDVLGVTSSASMAEIHSAYRSLVSKYHPDKVDSMGPEVKAVCEAKSKEINTAYEKAMKARGL